MTSCFDTQNFNLLESDDFDHIFSPLHVSSSVSRFTRFFNMQIYETEKTTLQNLQLETSCTNTMFHHLV